MTVYILTNTKDEPVGLYFPTRRESMTSGVIELISDYYGVSHKLISGIIGDEGVATVRTNTNLSWLKSTISLGMAACELVHYEKKFPTVDEIKEMKNA